MVDVSWVTPQIAVGRAFLDEDVYCLKNLGIDAIVDVRSEYCDNKELIEKLGLEFLHVDIDDGYIPSLEQLRKIFNFVEPLLDRKKKIFIHCQNGYGRSPLVVAAILAKRGCTISEAVSLLEEKYPKASFSLNQQNFIYIELKNFLAKGKD